MDTDKRRALARAFASVPTLEAPVHYHGGPLDGSFKVLFVGMEPPIQKEAGGHYQLIATKKNVWRDWDHEG